MISLPYLLKPIPSTPSLSFSLEGLLEPVLVPLSQPHRGSFLSGVTYPQGGRRAACSSCKNGAGGTEMGPQGGDSLNRPALRLGDRVRSSPGSARCGSPGLGPCATECFPTFQVTCLRLCPPGVLASPAWPLWREAGTEYWLGTHPAEPSQYIRLASGQGTQKGP